MSVEISRRPAIARTPASPAFFVRVLLRGTPAIFAAVALSGCFTSTDDFRIDAERFITERVSTDVGAEFTSVICDEPIDQQVGTRFACQAIDSDAGVWEFDNVIDAEGEFTVNISRRP